MMRARSTLDWSQSRPSNISCHFCI